MTVHDPWPALPYEEWAPTKKALHLYAQMLGKLKLALNHAQPEWLHTGLQLDARGLATGPLPWHGRVVDAAIDLFDGTVRLRGSDARAAEVALVGERSVAAVWEEFLAALRQIGVDAPLWDKPQEIADATPFAQDDAPRPFDLDQARRYHRLMSSLYGVFDEFRSPFFGRTGVQFWWGAGDLAVLLFSGRQVAPPAGLGHIMRYDLDAEHLNAGLWPGDDASPHAAVYAYIHPRPDGCATARIEPAAAGWVEAMGEWVLPYDEVRASMDPAAVVSEFLRSAYRAALDLGGWDERAQRYERPKPA